MAEVAIAIGVSLATAALSYALTPKPEPQRQEDLSVLKSEYGVAIPKIYGKQKVNGNVIWALDIDESKSGGKGGGEKYSYSATFAVALCEGEIQRINRIWLNNKLVYVGNSSNLGTQQASQNFLNDYCTFYLGTVTQDRDPTIEAIEGTANTPAFRNLVYIVFRDLPLEDYGNIVPQVSTEIIESVETYLSDVLSDVCLRGKLEEKEIDVSQLTNIKITNLRENLLRNYRKPITLSFATVEIRLVFSLSNRIIST
jgi:hypothetical protein